MTGFARHETVSAWGRICWELRTVNHRFLELSLRLPEDLRGLETPARDRIGQWLRRGKVDVSLRFQPDPGRSGGLTVNALLVEQLLEAASQVENLMPASQPLRTLDIMNWPGVLNSPPPDEQALSAALLAELDTALQQLLAHREREGAQLEALLQQRCEAILAEVAQLRQLLPGLLETQRERLRRRVEELQVSLDPERLELEVALLAQKTDVAEELDRLETHVREVRQSLRAREPVGRRLDFLMQELNREANTLGSKSMHTDTTQAAINLKVLIEQMREQIQNLE